MTKSLLGYGVLAGPFYVTVAVVQALTRDGFDLHRHAWSQLSNGELGWIQIANFALTGLMVLAFAAGLSRAALGGAQTAFAGAWAPRLVGAFGVSLLGAAAFRADPGYGFPAGTPAGPGQLSGSGAAHLMIGAVGFACLIAACFVLARKFAASGQTGWAWWSRLAGAVFGLAFVGIAAGSGRPVTIFGFVIGVVVVFAWLSSVSVHLYRTTAQQTH